MKRIANYRLLTLVVALGVLLPGAGASNSNWTDGMKEGKPAFKSMGPLAFGPEGILFVADTKAAAITAIVTGYKRDAVALVYPVIKVEGINQKIAGLLGTTADQILIDDLAVNPMFH